MVEHTPRGSRSSTRGSRRAQPRSRPWGGASRGTSIREGSAMPKLWRSKGGEHSRVDATWTAVWAGGGLCVAPHASPRVSRRREAVALVRVGWGEGEERAALRESCIHADVGSFGLHARREARDAGRRPGRLGEASGAGSRERGALHSWRERGGGGGGRCAGSLLLRLWPLANEACDGRRPCSEHC